MNACTSDLTSSIEEIKVKENQNKKKSTKNDTNSIASVEYETNPLSVENVENAFKQLGRNEALDTDKIYHYYKFDPNAVTSELLAIIEKDSTHHILDYPFASGKVYNEKFGENFEENIESLKDGNLYIVFKTGTDLEKVISTSPELKLEKLDELYLPKDDDEQLLEYLVNQNTSEERLLPCLLKRPKGRVRYQDQETGFMRPVPNIQVWALVFGIPVPTWTDAQGNYAIPYRFSAGTFIGTHAKNGRINVKPFNTTGGFFSVVPQLVSNFIIGSVHNAGWYNACRMRDDINIDFNVHGQPRYWAQILDAVNLHDTYTRQDGIFNAPWGLTWYAHWADAPRGTNSAPMLSHIHTNVPQLLLGILSIAFDTNINVTAPNFLKLLTGLPPSIITKRSPKMDEHYSEDLMKSCFHELAHGSLFVKVGGSFWLKTIANTIAVGSNPNGGYGTGNELWEGYTQVNEAWAEYVGKTHGMRIHPNGEVEVDLRVWQRYSIALEQDASFVNRWIPTGTFYDLNDPILNGEGMDNIAGYSIRQMFNVFTPTTNGMCEYKSNFDRTYPVVTNNQFDNILVLNLYNDCLR